MANRTRPNQILFFVSDDEKRIIKGKMKQLGTNNIGSYILLPTGSFSHQREAPFAGIVIFAVCGFVSIVNTILCATFAFILNNSTLVITHADNTFP